MSPLRAARGTLDLRSCQEPSGNPALVPGLGHSACSFAMLRLLLSSCSCCLVWAPSSEAPCHPELSSQGGATPVDRTTRGGCKTCKGRARANELVWQVFTVFSCVFFLPGRAAPPAHCPPSLVGGWPRYVKPQAPRAATLLVCSVMGLVTMCV